MSHRIKTFRWEQDGEKSLTSSLKVTEHIFDTEEQAWEFFHNGAESKASHGIKMYNDNDELIHVLNPRVEDGKHMANNSDIVETYA
jgi:hypothetical protein